MAIILPFVRTDVADAAMTEQLPTSDSDLPDTTADSAGWEELMLQAQDGDKLAYRALLQGITPHLRSITRRYLGRCEDAEDALQDVLMVVHGIRHTYERGRPFKPWLNTIATRRCIDLLRRRAHRLKHEIESVGDEHESPQTGLGPEEAVSRHHAVGTLRQAVAALPERQREAIRLLRLNELSLNEAAAQSDQSVGSLKVACHRALKSLHGILAKKESIR